MLTTRCIRKMANEGTTNDYTVYQCTIHTAQYTMHDARTGELALQALDAEERLEGWAEGW